MKDIVLDEIMLERLIMRFLNDKGKVRGRIPARMYKENGDGPCFKKKDIVVNLPLICELTGFSETTVRRSARKIQRIKFQSVDSVGL